VLVFESVLAKIPKSLAPDKGNKSKVSKVLCPTHPETFHKEGINKEKNTE
jgi:hypothetical protein